MAWFQNKLYAGASRHGEWRKNARRWSARDDTSAGTDLAERAPLLNQRGSIWCYDPQSSRWEQIFVAPMLGLPDGRPASREIGYRKMVVFQGRDERAPALYVTTISPVAGMILSSHDGKNFYPVVQPGNPPASNWSYRALLSFNGRLYTSPAGAVRGERITRHAAACPVVFENANPLRAAWQPISEFGLGDSTNGAIYEMAAMNGYLYAGTFNPYRGFQLWKTPGDDPYRWQRVIVDGAFRGKFNEAAASMCTFRNALYVGTGKQGIRTFKTPTGWSSGAELLRIYPDDSWELVVGEPRSTPQGSKSPLSGRGPGFDNPSNGVIWELAVHNGWLYAGTEDSSSFRALLRGFQFQSTRQRGAHSWENVIDTGAGFDLWRSHDGANWELVTSVGLGDPTSWGIESMASTPAGLFVGTVGMPQELVRRGALPVESAEIAGCSVWLGR